MSSYKRLCVQTVLCDWICLAYNIQISLEIWAAPLELELLPLRVLGLKENWKSLPKLQEKKLTGIFTLLLSTAVSLSPLYLYHHKALHPIAKSGTAFFRFRFFFLVNFASSVLIGPPSSVFFKVCLFLLRSNGKWLKWESLVGLSHRATSCFTGA